MRDILRVTEMDMARARRKMKRKIASALIAAMAETDADYKFIATRLGQDAEEIERWLVGLISGDSKCGDEASDLLLALGCEFDFSIRRYQEPRRPSVEQAEQSSEVAA